MHCIGLVCGCWEFAGMTESPEWSAVYQPGSTPGATLLWVLARWSHPRTTFSWNLVRPFSIHFICMTTCYSVYLLIAYGNILLVDLGISGVTNLVTQTDLLKTSGSMLFAMDIAVQCICPCLLQCSNALVLGEQATVIMMLNMDSTGWQEYKCKHANISWLEDIIHTLVKWLRIAVALCNTALVNVPF